MRIELYPKGGGEATVIYVHETDIRIYCAFNSLIEVSNETALYKWINQAKTFDLREVPDPDFEEASRYE